MIRRPATHRLKSAAGAIESVLHAIRIPRCIGGLIDFKSVGVRESDCPK